MLCTKLIGTKKMRWKSRCVIHVTQNTMRICGELVLFSRTLFSAVFFCRCRFGRYFICHWTTDMRFQGLLKLNVEYSTAYSCFPEYWREMWNEKKKLKMPAIRSVHVAHAHFCISTAAAIILECACNPRSTNNALPERSRQTHVNMTYAIN